MLLMLLAFGSFWFWVAAIAVFVFCVATVENEHGGWATLSLVGFIAAIHLLGDVNIFPWIVEHGLETLALAGSYFVVGTVYSILKWRFFMSHIGSVYKDERQEFIRLACPGMRVDENTPVPDGHRERWARHAIYVRGKQFYPEDLANINLRNHKSRITLWITYWPFSASWTLLNDPIRAITREIYERLTKLFRAIANSVLGRLSIDADISKDTPAARVDDPNDPDYLLPSGTVGTVSRRGRNAK